MVEALIDRDDTVRARVGLEGDEAVPFSASDLTLSTLPPMEGKTLRFAQGEAGASRAALTVPGVRARRRPRLDLLDLTQIALMLASGAICIDRIAWAVRP